MVLAFAGCSNPEPESLLRHQAMRLPISTSRIMASVCLNGRAGNEDQRDSGFYLGWHTAATRLIWQVMAGRSDCSIQDRGSIPSAGMQLPFPIFHYEEDGLLTVPRESPSSQWKNNLTLKSWLSTNGMRHFATIAKPVNTMADIKGLKIRVPQAVILQKAMQLIGANPVAITYGEIVTALQNKTIDGEEINITSAGSQKHYDVIKYISEIGLYPYPGPAVINGKFWKSLSPEDQKMFTDIFNEGQEKNIKEFIPETEDKLRKECREQGGSLVLSKPNSLSSMQIKPLDEYSARDPLIKAFIDKFK